MSIERRKVRSGLGSVNLITNAYARITGSQLFLPTSEITLSLWASKRNTAQEIYFWANASASKILSLQYLTNKLYFDFGTSGETSSGGRLTSTIDTSLLKNMNHIVCVGSAAAGVMKLWLNGQMIGQQTRLPGGLSYTSDLYLGATPTPGFYLNGVMTDFQLYSIALPDQKVRDLYAGLSPVIASPVCAYPFSDGTGTTITDSTGQGRNAALTNGTWQTDSQIGVGPRTTGVARRGYGYLNLVFDGNSLTSGTQSTEGRNYPAQTAGLLSNAGRNVRVRNLGVAGQTTQQMSADAATDVDTLLSRDGLNICVAWELTNDLVVNEPTAQAAYDNFVTYCQGRRAAGFKVVAVTGSPRSASGTPSDFETKRLAANALIRANWATFADALADAGADSRIGDTGDELDTTYYNADKVHMNNAGYGVVAGIVKDAILTLV
jgi:lysophospholipase L1-like esterase